MQPHKVNHQTTTTTTPSTTSTPSSEAMEDTQTPAPPSQGTFHSEETRKRAVQTLAAGVLTLFAAGWLTNLRTLLRNDRRRHIAADDATSTSAPLPRHRHSDRHTRLPGDTGIPPPVPPRLLPPSSSPADDDRVSLPKDPAL